MTNRARARAARAVEVTMRVVGDKEGKGGKAMAMATSVVGERTAMATKWAMVTKTTMGMTNDDATINNWCGGWGQYN